MICSLCNKDGMSFMTEPYSKSIIFFECTECKTYLIRQNNGSYKKYTFEEFEKFGEMNDN